MGSDRDALRRHLEKRTTRLERLGAWVARSRYPIVPVALALLLTAPSLWVGVQADDLHIRNTILQRPTPEGIDRSPWEPYSFLIGQPEGNRALMDHGWFPWWTSPHCRSRLLRPLTALTLMVDYRLWPDRPVFMHVQSLAWFALLVTAAALLYRRIMRRTLPAWTFGLAALLFALDEAHGLPAGWLANRNALLAAAFGCLTLLAHDRWRVDGRRWCALLAPLALLAALLAKEEAVSTAGYLLAYALFLDPGPRPRRFVSLLPCLLTGVLWYTWYKTSGGGVFGSDVYADPAHDPLRFAARVVHNAPLLLLGQWGFPPSDLSLIWSKGAFAAHWSWAMLFLTIMGVLLWPLLKGCATARFWALGAILSVVPVCAIFPSDRLLIFVGLGASGLLAMWLVGYVDGAEWVPRSTKWRRAARPAFCLFIVLHFIVAPVVLPINAVSMRFAGRELDRLFDTLPDDRAFADQTAVFVSTFSSITDLVWIHARMYRAEAIPLRTVHLNAACAAATLTRIDEQTLLVRPHSGYFPLRGAAFDDRNSPVASIGYLPQVLDRLVRSDDHPMFEGEVVKLPDVTVTVTALTPDGRPAEARFRFTKPLEDPTFRWLQTTPEGYVPFHVPPIGETVTVASPLP